MDWRKMQGKQEITLQGGFVHWQEVGGEAGQLLRQHFSPRHRQYCLEQAMRMGGAIRAHTGLEGMNADGTGILSMTKTYLQFVCSDSRVVPPVLDPGEHLIISVPLAGQSLGGGFSYKQVVDLLPALDGIVVEGHAQCGACKAVLASHSGQEFNGTLHDLVCNMDGDSETNLVLQVKHVADRVGKELLRAHQTAVFGVMNDIFAPLDQLTHTLNEQTIETNDRQLPKIQEAIDVYRHIIGKKREALFEPAAQAQHPTVLWLTGLTIYGLFRRGIGSEHEMVNEHRKGVIFKVIWQNPHDPNAIASARYILEHGDSVKQIVFTATSERDLWWDIESFINNQEVSFYLKKNPATELIGLIIDENGLINPNRIIRLAQ